MHRKTIPKIGAILAAAGMWLALAQEVRASFDLNYEFSGATPPSGAAPWLTATFSDVQDGVRLDLLTHLNGATEFVSEWNFNVSEAYIGHLIFGTPSKTGTFTDPAISQVKDSFKADGDGWFDIQFQFGTGSDATKFGYGESVTYLITSSVADFDSSDFNFLSVIKGGDDSKGPFYTAAHVQGIGPDGEGSGWIAPVPEPTTMIAGALLLLPFGMSTLRALRNRRVQS